MTLEVWLVYATTVLAFMVVPGPSHLLMLSNSMVHGFRPSVATAVGDLSANMLQMLAAGLGLAAVLAASQYALGVVKWAGVVYLLWLGIRMIRRAGAPSAGQQAAQRPTLGKLWLQGFLTSAANPKAVVFFAALFPQFIAADLPFATQFIILSATYILIDGAFLMTYGAGSDWISRRLKGNSGAMLDRVGGSVMICAALMLSLKTLRGGQ